MLSTVFLIVAIVLFALSAVPPLPYGGQLRGAGLAFFAAASLTPRL